MFFFYLLLTKPHEFLTTIAMGTGGGGSQRPSTVSRYGFAHAQWKPPGSLTHACSQPPLSTEHSSMSAGMWRGMVIEDTRWKI